MEYHITKERYFNLLDKMMETLYPKIRYKKVGRSIYFYAGKSLVKRFSWVGKEQNTIMVYSDFRETLEVQIRVYEELHKYMNGVLDTKLVLEFFKEWFSKKYGIIPKYVLIPDRELMNRLE